MRKITLDIGFSPGDIVVFTRAIRDLCEQYPDYDVEIKTCCPEIFQNNPFVNKKPKASAPVVIPIADNLTKAGFSLHEVATKPQDLFRKLTKKNELNAHFENGKWFYSNKEGVDLFYCKQKDKPLFKRETFPQVQYEDIHNAGKSGRHFSNAFYIELEQKLGIKIKQTSLLPDLHLTDEEKGWISQVEQEFNYKGKFWLVCSGYKSDYPLKNWGHDNWQKVVDILSDKIQFVQVGQMNDSHTHEPLKGALNLLGKTDLRQFIRLTYHAQGGCGHVSLLHHLMAGWQKPIVTVAGGREPRRWESYPHGRFIDTNGQLPCCSYDGCWLDGRIKNGENKMCTNMTGGNPRCMRMIKPEQVAQEIINYQYFAGDTS